MPPQDRTPHADLTSIYFSDFFGVSREVVEGYGAFDISLVTDLPLFIDPFLLFHSAKPEYQQLHEEIIDYVQFLRDKSREVNIGAPLLRAWFTFPEVKQNWFGYTEDGNQGSGLGMKFARDFSASLNTIFTSFGNDEVARGSHIEKVLLISSGVGRDNISDFVTNTIKHFLLEYTQTFALEYLAPEQRRRIAVRKAIFNYDTEAWVTKTYELPFVKGDFVILTPIDILTKDEVWINRVDMVRDYAHIADSVDDPELRAQINNYFERTLSGIRERDFKNRRRSASQRNRRAEPTMPPPTKKQKEEAAWETIRRHPGYMDYYVRFKETHGNEAEAQANERVRSSERLYVTNVRSLVAKLHEHTAFYHTNGSTTDEARERMIALKETVEKHGGWEQLYEDGKPIPTESEIRRVLRLVWSNVPNADEPMRLDPAVVEFKQAKNSLLERALIQHRRNEDGPLSVKGIIFFTDEERMRALGLIEMLRLADDPNIILIDARGA
ncbi:MAG: hypothetical protein AB1941_14300 [Gemmatimonadota bacterium]